MSPRRAVTTGSAARRSTSGCASSRSSVRMACAECWPSSSPATSCESSAKRPGRSPRSLFRCIGCLEAQLGRRLEPDDFTICSLNTTNRLTARAGSRRSANWSSRRRRGDRNRGQRVAHDKHVACHSRGSVTGRPQPFSERSPYAEAPSGQSVCQYEVSARSRLACRRRIRAADHGGGRIRLGLEWTRRTGVLSCERHDSGTRTAERTTPRSG